MKLIKGKKYIEYIINIIPNDNLIGEKLLALGVYEGAKISIKQFLPGKGPLIIKVGTGEVALSYEIANKIEVE